MKKISNWSLVGLFIGLSFAVLSAIRYFLLYPDTDKALAYIVLGMLICAVSWLYNRQMRQSYSIQAVEDYLDDQRFEKMK